jgi:hypothetical protein
MSLPKRRTPLPHNGPDRGAAAITIAITIFLLFGFAAIAIDATGLGFNERRQDQSAADVGALAAVQFAVPKDLGNLECAGETGIDLSRCNGAVEAMEVANATLDDSSLAIWSDATRCATPPAGFNVSPITDCVAFNFNNQRAWVRIPRIDKPTALARVIGIDTISTSADAIAGSSIGGSGPILPFLLPGNAAGGDYNCLKSSANPKFGACDDLPGTGNFGSMDFFLYGNVDFGYTSKCNGDTNGRLVANIARGIDHPLGLHPTGSGSGKEEASNCPDFSTEPDMADGQPGVGSNLEDGLLYGGSAYAPNPYPGRIQDSGGFLVRNAGGPKAAARVDDTPLWTFLLSNSGTPCDNGDVDTPIEMVACINWAKTDVAGPHVVFNNLLVTAQRLGWTPAVWEDDFVGGSSQPYHIKSFLPVYIDTTFYSCTGSQCDIMHTPGVGDPGGGCPSNPNPAQITCGTPGPFNKNLVAVTAYVLSQEIVPDNAKTPFPGAENQRTFNLTE